MSLSCATDDEMSVAVAVVAGGLGGPVAVASVGLAVVCNGRFGWSVAGPWRVEAVVLPKDVLLGTVDAEVDDEPMEPLPEACLLSFAVPRLARLLSASRRAVRAFSSSLMMDRHCWGLLPFNSEAGCSHRSTMAFSTASHARREFRHKGLVRSHTSTNENACHWVYELKSQSQGRVRGSVRSL